MATSEKSTPREDRDLAELHDIGDRDELRNRYYGLLQELRVVLPGVQVLLAFLLTAPFAQRFGELDATGRNAFGFAMVTAMLSVVCLLTPTVFHRIAERRERISRLRWGIRMEVVGLALLAIALLTALWCIARLVFGTSTAWWLTALVAVTIGALWFALPVIAGRGEGDR